MSTDPITPLPPKGDPWRANELERRRRLRADAKRPLGVNLAEGLAHIDSLLPFLGAARHGR